MHCHSILSYVGFYISCIFLSPSPKTLLFLPLLRPLFFLCFRFVEAVATLSGKGTMSLKEKKSSDGKASESSNCCFDCKTTKTPLWRSGPAGAKSLCNACGIKYRKRKRAVMGLEKVPETKKRKSDSTVAVSASAPIPASQKFNGKEIGLGGRLKIRLYFLGSEILPQKPLLSSSWSSSSSSSSTLTLFKEATSVVKKKKRCQRRRKVGEEEQAAFALLALSCGSFLH